jgi:hypothetical protein
MSGFVAGALAIGLLGQTLQAQPMKSDVGPCEARDQTVKEWRAAGRPVYFHQVSGWCVVSTLDGQTLLSQQWRAVRTMRTNPESEGWEVRIPLDLLLKYHQSNELVVHASGYPGSIRIARVGAQDLVVAHRIGEQKIGLAPRDWSHSSNHPTLISSQLIRGESRTVISLKTSVDEVFQIFFTGGRP